MVKTVESRGDITPKEMRESVEPWRAVIKERIRRHLRKGTGRAQLTFLTRKVGCFHSGWKHILQEMIDEGEVVTAVQIDADAVVRVYFSLKEEEETEEATG